LLVSPDNVPALTDAINKLAGSKKLQDRLSKGALDLAASFSWSRIAEKTIALYRHVLEQRR
jgi:glycosyltransferase involved in cell wall biosynthesis